MDVNSPWQVVRNESIDNPTDARASEEEKKGPAATHLGDDERHRPAGDLHQGAKEVALVDVALAQVGSILYVAVVAHEPHHAVKMFTFRRRKKEKIEGVYDCQCLCSRLACNGKSHYKDNSPDDSAEKGVEAKIFRFEHLEESGFGDWIV